MVAWFAFSIGTQRVLPLPDGEHLLRPPGASKDRMRIVVDGAQCQISPSSASFQVQQLAPSPDHVWVSHLIATPDSVLMIIRGDDGLDFTEQAVGAIDWLVGAMNDEDSAFIGWRLLGGSEPLEACSIERSVYDDVMAGRDQSIQVFAKELSGWCRIEGLIDESVQLLLVSPTWFPGGRMQVEEFEVAPPSGPASSFAAADPSPSIHPGGGHDRSEPINQSDSPADAAPGLDDADADDVALSDDDAGLFIDAFLSELREQARPAGTRSLTFDSLSGVASASSTTWSPTDGALLLSGECAADLAAQVAHHMLRGRTAHQVHLHVLSEGPVLGAFAGIPHAGTWCVDGNASRARRALAVLDTELTRRQNAAEAGNEPDPNAALQVVVLGGFAYWSRLFGAEHNPSTTQRLAHLVTDGPRLGFGIVIVDQDGTEAFAALSLVGASGVTRTESVAVADRPTLDHLVEAARSLTESGVPNESSGRLPYRLNELPKSVPFVALAPAKVDRNSLAVAVGLDSDRQVVWLQSSGSDRVTYLMGALGAARTNLIGVIQQGALRAGVTVHRAVADLNLTGEQAGSTSLAIVDADRIAGDELDVVLSWGSRRSTHHVIVVTDEAWWTAHREGTAASLLRFDGTAGRLDGPGATELRIADAPKEKP